MHIPDRILRAVADEDQSRTRRWSPRQIQRHQDIQRAATRIFARFGLAPITFRALAVALALSPATLRQHFVDLDSILAEILRNHLMDLLRAISQVPEDTANAHVVRRQAYLAHTRTLSGFTDTHRLWIRERHALPEDLLTPLEQTFAPLAQLLAGEDATEAQTARVLALLDNEIVTQSNIEPLLQELPRLNATPLPPQPPMPQPAPYAHLSMDERLELALAKRRKIIDEGFALLANPQNPHATDPPNPGQRAPEQSAWLQQY